MSIWSGSFWAAAFERALRTFAQAGASLLVLDQVPGLLNVDWVAVGSVAGLSALLSLLLSVGGNQATKEGPSMTRAEVVQPAVQVAPGDLNGETAR